MLLASGKHHYEGSQKRKIKKCLGKKYPSIFDFKLVKKL